MSILATVILAMPCFAWAESERYYQEKFNNEVAHGKLEVVLKHGRADIVNDEYAIEVDFAKKWKEGIEQCLRYATDTRKKPGLVLITGKNVGDVTKCTMAKTVCWLMDIKLWIVKIKENNK